jgi:nucleotide-binding universal stress UspA family protein
VLDYATPELPRHVVSYIGEERMREVERSGREEAEGYLSSWKENLEGEGLTVEKVVLTGEAAEEILRYINKNQVDLVVMSTHGRSGISRWTWGSVTDRVLRHSPAPLVVVTPRGYRTGS